MNSTTFGDLPIEVTSGAGAFLAGVIGLILHYIFVSAPKIKAYADLLSQEKYEEIANLLLAAGINSLETRKKKTETLSLLHNETKQSLTRHAYMAINTTLANSVSDGSFEVASLARQTSTDSSAGSVQAEIFESNQRLRHILTIILRSFIILIVVVLIVICVYFSR